jgi:hypothetical protein
MGGIFGTNLGLNVGTLPRYGQNQSSSIQSDLEGDINTPWDTGGSNRYKYGGAMGGFNRQYDRAGYAGKLGMGLGAAGAAAGLIGGLGSLFGGRQGPTRQEIEEEALARGGMGQADQFGGEMGSMGMGLQNSGRSMLERGRSGYLNSMFDPNVATGQRAQLASDLAQSRRGVGNTVGLIGGPLAGAQFARNASAYTPQFAQGSTQIGNNAVNRRSQGYQSMAGFGQQDFNQGLGLRNQGYGIQSQGRQQLGATLGRLSAAAQARKASQQAMIGGLFKAAGSAATGGIF